LGAYIQHFANSEGLGKDNETYPHRQTIEPVPSIRISSFFFIPFLLFNLSP